MEPSQLFQKLKEAVEDQRKVRICEEEGSVWPIESDLSVFERWGLISFDQFRELKAILKS